MKRLHIIGSSIHLSENDKQFNNVTKVRSGFSTEERFRQTVYTIYSICTLYPDDDIWIIDSSLEDIDHYFNTSNFISNKVKRFYLKDINKDIAHTVNTHHNKSYCESLMLKTFFEFKKNEIKDYDFITKISGRYWIDWTFNERSGLTIKNKNKLFIKEPTIFEKPDKKSFGYDNFLLEGQPNWKIYSTPTVIYAFGSDFFDSMIQLLSEVINGTVEGNHDGEYLWSYFISKFNIPTVKIDWSINGWGGVHKKLCKY